MVTEAETPSKKSQKSKPKHKKYEKRQKPNEDELEMLEFVEEEEEESNKSKLLLREAKCHHAFYLQSKIVLERTLQRLN